MELQELRSDYTLSLKSCFFWSFSVPVSQIQQYILQVLVFSSTCQQIPTKHPSNVVFFPVPAANPNSVLNLSSYIVFLLCFLLLFKQCDKLLLQRLTSFQHHCQAILKLSKSIRVQKEPEAYYHNRNNSLTVVEGSTFILKPFFAVSAIGLIQTLPPF